MWVTREKMRQMRLIFDDREFRRLEELKKAFKSKTWEKFIIELTEMYIEK